MKHRVYVVFEMTDALNADASPSNPDPFALPNFVSQINQGLLSGYGLQNFRGRIVSAVSIEDPSPTPASVGVPL